MTATITVPTAEAMEAFGARLAPHLRVGDLVFLNGELGAGKTTLTRGLGSGLGVRGAVTSPTFVLARTHPRASGAPLVHVDAYRLGSSAELDDLDLDFDGSIVVVEWGDGLLEVPAYLRIDIRRPHGGDPLDPDQLDGDEPREVDVSAVGERWAGVPEAVTS